MKRNALPLLLIPMLVIGCSKDIQRVSAPRAAVPDPAPRAPTTARPKPTAKPGDIYYIDEYGEVERGGRTRTIPSARPPSAPCSCASPP